MPDNKDSNPILDTEVNRLLTEAAHKCKHENIEFVALAVTYNEEGNPAWGRTIGSFYEGGVCEHFKKGMDEFNESVNADVTVECDE